jgi:hypothetical protein
MAAAAAAEAVGSTLHESRLKKEIMAAEVEEEMSSKTRRFSHINYMLLACLLPCLLASQYSRQPEKGKQQKVTTVRFREIRLTILKRGLCLVAVFAR